MGGIDIGFEQTKRFKTIYANEIDKYPVKTYELNSKLKVDNRSICDIQPNEIPDFDVALAGFPCTRIIKNTVCVCKLTLLQDRQVTHNTLINLLKSHKNYPFLLGVQDQFL